MEPPGKVKTCENTTKTKTYGQKILLVQPYQEGADGEFFEDIGNISYSASPRLKDKRNPVCVKICWLGAKNHSLQI